jgi:hypothetical protein
VIASRPVGPRMRSPLHRRLALALAAVLVAPCAGLPQEPARPPAAPPAAQGAGLTGSFAGWATLTNDAPGAECRYEGTPGTPSVRLELDGGESLAGSIAIDLPPPGGSACPALRKRYTIAELAISQTTVSFSDSGGNEWTLGLRERGSVLHGLVAWRQGGEDEPLAEGFSLPDGRHPPTRLSGEVELRRTTAGGAAAAPAPAPGKAGSQVGHIAAILGANVVGLGLLYGANKLGQGTVAGGVVTCSPRTCVVGQPGAPCFCEGNVLSGAQCGTTPSGAPLLAPCDGKSVPCEAGLSCNSGICEDRFGRCPY